MAKISFHYQYRHNFGLRLFSFFIALFIVTMAWPIGDQLWAQGKDGGESPKAYTFSDYPLNWNLAALDPAIEEQRLEAVKLLKSFKTQAKAWEILIKAAQAAQELYGPDDPRTIGLRIRLAYAYMEAQKEMEAIKIGSSILNLKLPDYSQKTMEFLFLKHLMATVYGRSDDTQKAVSYYSDLVEIMDKVLGQGNVATIIAKSDLGDKLFESEDYDGAIKIVTIAIKSAEQYLGEEDSWVVDILGDQLEGFRVYIDGKVRLDKAQAENEKDRQEYLEAREEYLKALLRLKQLQDELREQYP
ncbi:MAG: tetratricopeptide repeat protein [Deltaproteobacteria bacterium]|jgi:hypothetical protein|nr:tetratricopeptide repeat protein [Deltaproteobacteria bacterium]